MALAHGTLSQKAFSDAAETFGYTYTDLSVTPSAVDHDTPLFEGSLGFQSLPCGISLCVSDLKSLCDSQHDGVVERSLTIAVVLGDGTCDCQLGVDGRLVIEANTASVVSVSDAARMAGRYRAGQRARCLLVRARPEDFADETIAEQIESSLKATSVAHLPMSHRSMLLADELAAPSAQGGVGRLLAESCALELFARALMATQARSWPRQDKLSGRDYAKMLLVRDRMLANPGDNFTLDDLAREAAVSVSVLKAKFPLAFGQSVFSFLRDARLYRARQGLEQEGWTVSEAAYFAGYRHQSNFSSAFRRKFGMPPRDAMTR